MSRTAHHIGRQHWNVKEPYFRWGYDEDQYIGGSRSGWRSRKLKPDAVWGLVQDEHEIGLVLHDLRFYAGCRRVPQRIRRHVTEDSWLSHGGSDAVQGIARKFWNRQRTEERTYGLNIRKTARAGGDLEETPEPDGRTRHSAIWDAW